MKVVIEGKEYTIRVYRIQGNLLSVDILGGYQREIIEYGKLYNISIKNEGVEKLEFICVAVGHFYSVRDDADELPSNAIDFQIVG